MRNGHAYKIPLLEIDGTTISHSRLKAIFHTIVKQAPAEINWLSILTTENRDDWSKVKRTDNVTPELPANRRLQVREELIAFSPSNATFVSTIETSLFSVCLEDGSPTTPNERAEAFLLDVNRNRWLDKTLSFVVAANGESALFCDHAMVDGTHFVGIINAVKTATVDHVEDTSPDSSEDLVSEARFTYLPVEIPVALSPKMLDHRASHIEAVIGYTLQNYTFEAYGALYLRERKLPPKTVFQLVVQVAVHQHGVQPQYHRRGKPTTLPRQTSRLVERSDRQGSSFLHSDAGSAGRQQGAPPPVLRGGEVTRTTGGAAHQRSRLVATYHGIKRDA